MNFEQARFNMVEQQIRPWEVLDPRVLAVLPQVPRERFVPDAWQGLAFADFEVPLGQGQVMLAPKMEARLLQALALGRKDRVLEIGTGSGYLTACLARMAADVVTVELHPELAAQAEAKVRDQGIGNVRFLTGDAFVMEIPGGPFDAIAVTGALPLMDERFCKLLKVGGRLFVVVGAEPAMQAMLITRVGEDQFRREALFETVIPALEGAPQPEAFRF